MPLSDHEQQILAEIERRLAEEDPRLVEQVGRTDLYTHLARRVRIAALVFLAGALMLGCVIWSLAVAAMGFIVMVMSALFIYRYLGQLGRDQIRAMQNSGPLSLTSLLGALAMRFRSQASSRDDDTFD